MAVIVDDGWHIRESVAVLIERTIFDDIVVGLRFGSAIGQRPHILEFRYEVVLYLLVGHRTEAGGRARAAELRGRGRCHAEG